MKAILSLLLVCICALAQQPSAPTNLRITGETTTTVTDPDIINLVVVQGANNPLALPIDGYSAWWMPEPCAVVTNYGGVFLTNAWKPEASIDGVNWNLLPICHAAFLDKRSSRISGVVGPRWNYTEAGSNWMVRIRRLPPLKIQ